MKAFVINLRKRKDRLIDFKKIDFPFKVEVLTGIEDENGSLGCIKSHLECYKRFTKGINIIFEDDCLQINDLDVFFKALKQIGNDWDVIYLGSIVKGDIMQRTENLDLLNYGWGTQAIAYNGTKFSNYILQYTAEHILKKKKNIDTFLVYNLQRNTDFKCYITNPQIFIQKDSYSDVINENRSYPWRYGNRATIYIGIATMKGREESLKKAIYSLSNQSIKPTKIFVYDNENSENLTDNGKFYKLKDLGSCYYFSCDDDLFYSHTYIESMIKDIQLHQCIITHHGRILKGQGLNYYRGHQTFRCLDENRVTAQIDVAGTGVTAFHTDYFKPDKIHQSEYKRMSDLVFSLEAKRQQKTIMLTPHKKGFVMQLDIDHTTSCHATESVNPINQNKLADEIYNLK